MDLPEISDGDAATARTLEDRLLQDLRDGQAQGRNRTTTLVMHDTDGTLIAGLTGAQSYGWLLIKVLWVAPDRRGRGLGRALVARAAQDARLAGAHAMWLDTSNPKAREFYEALGFSVFTSLENAPDDTPPNHRRWFLKCPL
ncbi:MAG: GNAT family N-acetyltransferase [Pseudomonadota bacterium]